MFVQFGNDDKNTSDRLTVAAQCNRLFGQQLAEWIAQGLERLQEPSYHGSIKWALGRHRKNPSVKKFDGLVQAEHPLRECGGTQRR